MFTRIKEFDRSWDYTYTSVFLLIFVYYHICRLGSFMEDFSYRIKMRESILMSYFTKNW